MKYILMITLSLFSLFADDYDLIADLHYSKMKELPIQSWEYVEDFSFIEYKDEILSVFYVNEKYSSLNKEIQSTIRNSLCRENAMRLYQFRLPTKTHCLFPPDVESSYQFLLRN